MAWTRIAKPTTTWNGVAAPSSSNWEPEDRPAGLIALEDSGLYLLEDGGMIQLENISPSWTAIAKPS